MNAPKSKANANIGIALTYANKQIDQFSQRGRLTFSELALIVDALYAMSNVSGSMIFAYALQSRAKTLTLNPQGTFAVRDMSEGMSHVIPANLRDPQFYGDYNIRYEAAAKFVPLFALDLGADDVVLKNTVWLQSSKGAYRLPPLLLGASIVSAAKGSDQRHLAVGMPIVSVVNGQPKCSIMQVPTPTFDIVRRVIAQGNQTLRIRRAFSGAHAEVNVRPDEPLLARENVQAVVAEFWQKFRDYGSTVSSQNANMPKNVSEALTHTLINLQKPLSELSAQLL